MANSYDASNDTHLSEDDRILLRRREASLGKPYRLFYQRPLHIVRGEGVHLYDAEGNEYLDAYNNVPVVGHSNPVVQQRVSEQLTKLNTHTRYLTREVVDYAERLTGLLGHDLTQAIFVCTGSEAVDLALRVSRHVTGRRGVIATSHAYHGTTEAAAAISPSLGPNNPIPSEVVLVRAPDLSQETPEAAASLFAQRVESAVQQLRERGHEPAALIVDSVLSSDGLQGIPPNLLQQAAAVIRSHGGLYIADEVQSGFGRTGQWWGFPVQGVEPDLVVAGKPMGNGMPIAALFGKPEHLDTFGTDMRYFNTFGGNPVSVAAGQAVLDELTERQLPEQAARVGADILQSITHMARDLPLVSGVRGTGLFFAVDVVKADASPDPLRASQVVNHMRENRVLISASGPAANVLKIRPPLVFGDAHAPRLLESLESALQAVA